MSKIGKITVYVEQGMHSQVIRVRTTGRAGAVSLNTVSLDTSYDFRTSAADAKLFWGAILALAETAVLV
jgi:hypothetical protein